MSETWSLVVVLLLMLLAGNPYTGWRHYGFYASGIVGVLTVVVVILLLCSVL